jgi:hypothetical protein
MNMNKKRLVEIIAETLGPVVQPHGFAFRKTAQDFHRRTPAGWQRLYISVIDYSPEFRFTLPTGVRVDVVENLFNQFSGAVGSGQAMTTTAIVPLARFAVEGRSEYVVRGEPEARAAAGDLAGVVGANTIGFLDRFQSLEQLCSMLVDHPVAELDATMLLSRAMHHVALAYLARSSRLSSLMESYSETLRSAPAFDRDRFEALRRYIEQHPKSA